MSIYDIRKAGREYCQTEGSEHYKTEDKVEPIDLIIALGYGEGFCMGSIIKYAARFKRTQNLQDLRKVSDYAHIMCGCNLPKDDTEQGIVKCRGKNCYNRAITTKKKMKECLRDSLTVNPDFSECVWNTKGVSNVYK